MPEFMRRPLEGLLVNMPISVDEQQEMHYDRIRSNIDMIADAGVAGFAVFSSMGQLSSITDAEFDIICDVVVTAGHARDLIVVVGTTAQNQYEATRRSVYAENAGADAALLATPYVLPLTNSGVVRFYEDVAGAIRGDIALMVYNFQGLTGINITADMWRDHLLDIPQIKALKESNTELPHYDDVLLAVADRVCVFSAPETAFRHASAFGAVGVAGILGWVAPRVAVRYVRECRNGNWNDPWVLAAHQAFLRASNTLRRQGMPSLKSFELGYLNAMVEFGGGMTGPPRSPYEPLPEPALAVLNQALDGLASLERDLVER